MANKTAGSPVAKILLVDDHPDTLLTLESILSPLQQTLIKAHSGEEALKHLINFNTDFALVIMDVKMPKMDGFETAALIRERDKTQHIPIIFLTGVEFNHTQVFKGYTLGAVDYILKPFEPEILKSKVKVFVDLFEQREEIKRQTELLKQSNLALQKEIEERLQLSMIVDSSEDAIISNTLDGTILSWNKGAEQIFGYSSLETKGQPLSMLLHSNYPEAIQRILEQIKQGKKVEHFETSCTKKDGKHINISLTLSPLKDSSLKIIGASVIARNITERNMLLKEILEAGEKVQQRLGLELHDDLCQQLTGISYLCKALEENLVQKSLAEASKAALITHQLDKTISYTRSLVKELMPVPLESNGLIPALQILASNIENLASTSCSISGSMDITIEDSALLSHLYRIVQETAHRAIKQGQAKHLDIKLAVENKSIVIAISDDGLGILKSEISREDTWLKSVHYRAGLIGASLNIQNREGKGTTVTCSLPRKNISPIFVVI